MMEMLSFRQVSFLPIPLECVIVDSAVVRKLKEFHFANEVDGQSTWQYATQVQTHIATCSLP